MVEAAAATSEGESIDDYRLVRPLGRDGATFLAHDRFLDRAVVISLLPAAEGARAERLAVARAFARVSHPNLNRVHRVREGGARPYVVAGFVRGQRLDAIATPMIDARVLELGRGLAGALAALHASDVAHGEVCAERVVLSEEGAPRLVGLDGARARADEAAKRADVAGLLALLGSIADRDLRGTLASLTRAPDGVATAEELRRAIDALAHPALAQQSLSENPYRGLRAFDREHAGVFFGREREVAELLDRLRSQPWLLVAGRSGTGKSSLARAGVAVAVADGALGERAAWEVATMVPGVHPLLSLARALAPIVDLDADELCAALRKSPSVAGRLVRARTGRGLLLVVDQLEEAITLAPPDERAAFCDALERFGALAPGVRVVFTLRGDFLDRLVELGTFGRALVRAAYVLPAMSEDGLREAIVSPARARGIAFETPAMVDALVKEVRHHDEALPLLSFALTELWSARDASRRVIPEDALRRSGGAVAALARHGDLLLATLREDERVEARRILLALVTAASTRARKTSEDLVGHGGAAARAALEALVRGRLVVAGEAYEIAHEALARVWPRLRAWLDEASEARAAAARLAVAAREWGRLGRGQEGLASERLLRDLAVPGALDGASDEARAFVEASQDAVHRARSRRRALRIGAPVGALLLVALIAFAVRWGERRQAHAFVVARLAEADPKAREAVTLDAQVAAARQEAFARYDADDPHAGDARWRDALALARRESDAFAAASAPLGLALARDPLDPDARARAADLASLWLLAAERDHEPDVARDLVARLGQLDDDGSRRARLAAPAHLRVTTTPRGARVVLHAVRLDADGRRMEDEGRAIDLDAPLELAPGSYVLAASANGRYATRLPVSLDRASDERIDVPLPLASAIPAGFVFIPAGTSLLGAADVDGVRNALLAEPEHAVHVEAFVIGENEVTYADYFEFLASLSATERIARRPHATDLEVTYAADGVPSLRLGAVTARLGAMFCRPKRSARRCQDWRRFPVAGITWDDAQAYFAWLARGRVPGARICSEREWERAARGADGRLYAHGDDLRVGDANFDATYAVDEDQMGPDEIGSFPADRSPFGLLDMNGNMTEWVGVEGATHVARGGAWNVGAFGDRSSFRHVHGGPRYTLVGVRACANAPVVR
jgi:formylglycine-generating enzyme required for sulfatase activity